MEFSDCSEPRSARGRVPYLLAIGALALWLGPGPVGWAASAPVASVPSQATAAAQKGLTELKAMATPRTYRPLGFRALSEAGSSRLDTPLVVYRVPLDKLRKFVANVAPRTLLTGGTEFIYPVLAGQNPRSSVTVTSLKSGWQATAYGKAGVIEALEQFRSVDSKRRGTPAGAYSEVLIPALNLRFLGRIAGEELTLIPLRSIPAAGLAAGTPYSATIVFAKLAPQARANNGQPT